MNIKKTFYLLLSGVMIFSLSACSNYTEYSRERGDDIPVRHSTYERRISRRSAARIPVESRAGVPAVPIPERAPTNPRHIQRPAPRQLTPKRAIPRRNIPRSAAPAPSVSVMESPMTEAISPATSHIARPPVAQAAPQTSKPPTSQESVPNRTVQAAGAHEAPKDDGRGMSNHGTARAPGKVLASHTTKFDAKDENRTNNIIRAGSSINGHVVEPGMTFSYNQTVGPTIERRGYEEGTIFVQGEKKKGFGGGVCQVSTTLCVAVDKAGMTIVERHDHSRPVSYAKEGEEAATSYGGIDFKFKNDNPYPVVINCSVEGGTVTVSICEG